MSAISKLEAWYSRQCNGLWEHSYGVTIGTLDNPGWIVSIDLVGTKLEAVQFSTVAVGVGADAHPDGADWISCKIDGHQWKGAGDQSKLERIITEFVSWAEKHDS